jgi:hypothetical protein
MRIFADLALFFHTLMRIRIKLFNLIQILIGIMLPKIMKIHADPNLDWQYWSSKWQPVLSAAFPPISFSEDSLRLAADDLCRDVAQDMFTEEEGGEVGGRLEFQVYNLFDDIF